MTIKCLRPIMTCFGSHHDMVWVSLSSCLGPIMTCFGSQLEKTQIKKWGKCSFGKTHSLHYNSVFWQKWFTLELVTKNTLFHEFFTKNAKVSV